jgi:histidyl-tRNA synthetase
MTFANNKGIPFVIMAGEDEMKENIFTLKNMQSGEQEKSDIHSIIAKIQSDL